MFRVKKKLLDFAIQGKKTITQRLADFRKNPPKDRPMIGTPKVTCEASARNQAVAACGIGVVNSLVEKLTVASRCVGPPRRLSEILP